MVAPGSQKLVEPEASFQKATAFGEEANSWLQEYLLERAEIEGSYAERLRKLQTKFSGRPFPAPRDGTLTKAWEASMNLTKDLVENHKSFSEKLSTLGANVADGWGKQYGLTRYLLTNEMKSSNLAYKDKTKVMRSLGDRYNAAGAALEQLKKDDPKNTTKIAKAESDLRSADQAYRESVVQLKKEKSTYDLAGDAFESKWRTLEEARITSTSDTLVELVNAEKSLTTKRRALVTVLANAVALIDQHRDINLFTTTFRWPQLSPMSISGPGPRDPTTNQVTSVPLKDLFFNIRLDVAYDKNIPIVLSRCIEAVEARGLDREGIYRVPGKAADRELLTSAFERDESAVDLTEHGPYDVNAIASLVKYYIRQLPEPLFPIDSKDVAEYPRIPEGQKPFWLIQKLQLGPPTHKTRAHQHTMRVLIDHLSKIVEHSETNKMTLINIATIFAPVIFNTDADDDSKDTGSRTNLSNIFARKDSNGLEDKAREIDTLALITEDTIRLRNLIFLKLDGAYPHVSTPLSSKGTVPRRSSASVLAFPSGTSPSGSCSILATTPQSSLLNNSNGINGTANGYHGSGSFSSNIGSIDHLPARNDSLAALSSSTGSASSLSASPPVAASKNTSRQQPNAGVKIGSSTSVSLVSFTSGDMPASPKSPYG